MIVTDRLILRRWRPADLAPFAAICADAQVMDWLGSAPLPRAQAEALVAQWQARIETVGSGLWAVERRADGALIGMSGLQWLDQPDHPMAPCVELAIWQARAVWGQGYAREAAAAVLRDGFLRLGLNQIMGFTAATNARSQKLMASIGMRRAPARDFDHPALARGATLSAHVVYAIAPHGWMQHLATWARYA